jgi:DNA-binding NarL/FixJ family response regulator
VYLETNESSSSGPLFPATPEQLLERRAAMRSLIYLAAEAHQSGAREVDPAAIARLASTFSVPVTITIEWDASADVAQPSIMIRGPRRPALRIPDSLTPREADVASLVAEGLSNAEVARRLGISVATVKDHVHHILERTGYRNRTALTAGLRGSDAH